MKLKLDGHCVCGRDSREDPNDDCERCQLIARIDDLTTATVEDSDMKQMLRDELDALRRELAEAKVARDFAVKTMSDNARELGRQAGVAISERDAARAEAGRLREAMRVARRYVGTYGLYEKAWQVLDSALATPADDAIGKTEKAQ